MGQLFNRIKDISSSYRNNKEDGGELFDFDQDEDLKDLIDNLDNKPPKDENNIKNLSVSEAYSILEIRQNADISEIRAAYKQKLKEYHPDKTENLGKEIKELAARKTLEINSAYNLIKKHKN